MQGVISKDCPVKHRNALESLVETSCLNKEDCKHWMKRKQQNFKSTLIHPNN